MQVTELRACDFCGRTWDAKTMLPNASGSGFICPEAHWSECSDISIRDLRVRVSTQFSASNRPPKKGSREWKR